MATIAKYEAVVRVGPLRLTVGLAGLAAAALADDRRVQAAGVDARSVGLELLSNGRSERVTTNQQLVGRLAMEHLGGHTSGPLMRGEVPRPGRLTRARVPLGLPTPVSRPAANARSLSE